MLKVKIIINRFIYMHFSYSLPQKKELNFVRCFVWDVTRGSPISPREDSTRSLGDQVGSCLHRKEFKSDTDAGKRKGFIKVKIHTWEGSAVELRDWIMPKSQSGVFIPPVVGIGDIPLKAHSSSSPGWNPQFPAFSLLFGSSGSVMAPGTWWES